jgi:ribosomal protein L24E
MSVEVKNGGRTDFVCDGCGEIITKGTAHLRAGNSPEFLRFHNAKCEAKYNKAKKVDAKAEKAAKKDVAPVEVEAPVEPEVEPVVDAVEPAADAVVTPPAKNKSGKKK